MNYQCLEDRLLLRPSKKKDEKTDGGLIIPDTVKMQTAEGVVVAIGAGCYARETGVFMPTVLAKGDIVLYPGGDRQFLEIPIIHDDGKKEICLMMRESEVLAKIGREE